MNIDALLKLYQQGQDNVLMRYTLGNEFFKLGQLDEAEAHLRAALAHDDEYSAAWKILGRTLAQAERHAEAIEVYERGMETAQIRGDIQAAKEMSVFAKRSRKALAQAAGG